MSEILLTVLYGSILFGGLAMSSSAGELDEEAEIRQAIENCYFRGLDEGDHSIILQLFLPETRLIFVRDGEMTIWTQEEWAQTQIFDPENRPDLAWEREIVSVDIAESAACAKVISTSEQVQFIDYLSLLKIDGRWRVVNKIFHANWRN